MSADAFGAGGSDAQQTLQSFWPRVMEEIRNLTVVRFVHTLINASDSAVLIWYQTHKQRLNVLTEHKTVHFFQKDFRVQELPLARIKKIMKLDEDVKVGGLPRLPF